MTSEELQYWLDRDNYYHKTYLKEVDKIEKELKKYYRRYKRELNIQIRLIKANMDDYNTTSTQLKLDYLQKELASVTSIINSINTALVTLTTTTLSKNYLSNYSHILKDLEKAFGRELMVHLPDNKLVEEIIRTNWSGLTYSERIWRNCQNLEYAVKEILTNGVIKGSSYKTMVNQLMKKYDTSYNRAYGLLKTELKQCITRSTLDTYEKCNIEYVETITSGKDNVCPECKRKAHKKVRVDKAKPGLNVAPYHTHCTCSVIPVVDISKYKGYGKDETIVI